MCSCANTSSASPLLYVVVYVGHVLGYVIGLWPCVLCGLADPRCRPHTSILCTVVQQWMHGICFECFYLPRRYLCQPRVGFCKCAGMGALT